MCESTVYTTDNVKIMEDVISIKINDDIIGGRCPKQQKHLNGRIVEIDLDKHAIYIKIS